jgi:ribosomal protein L9
LWQQGEEIARIRRLIEQKQKEAEKARAQREQMRAQKEEIRKRRRQRVQMREGRSAMHGEVEEDEDAEEVGGTGGVAAVLGQGEREGGA